MNNELIKIGPFIGYGYGLMIGIGVIAAYITAELRAKIMKLEHERIFGLTVWALVGGMLGAKLLYILTQIKEIISDPGIILKLSDGFVVYGGIIGGILAGFLYCRGLKLSFFQYFDLAIPSVALAQGFGRIGCFLAGCCYGIETASPLGVIFHESKYAPNGTRLLPTQLISSGLDFLNFLVLIMLAKRFKTFGLVSGFYLIFYSVGRFILEFFRGDLVRGSVGGLSTSQFISIFIFVVGWVMILVKTRGARSIKGDEQAA